MSSQNEIEKLIEKEIKTWNQEEKTNYKFLLSHMIMIDRGLLKQQHTQDIVSIIENITDPTFATTYYIIKDFYNKHKVLPLFIKEHMKHYFKTQV